MDFGTPNSDPRSANRARILSPLIGAAAGLIAATLVCESGVRPVGRWTALVMVLGLMLVVWMVRVFTRSRLAQAFYGQSPDKQRKITLISLAIGLGLMWSIPTAPRFGWDAATNGNPVQQLMMDLAIVLSQALLWTCAVAAALFWFLSRPDQPIESRPIPRLAILHYALPCIAVWSVYHLALWPAIMNADAGDQWEQIHSLHFDDWHPAFLAFTFWLISKACDSPATVVAVQIFSLALAFGWGLVLLRRAGMGPGVAWCLALFLALSPLNAIWVNCIAKDTPFGIVMVWLTLIVFEAVITRGKSLSRASRLAALIFLLPPAMLFRHNGIAPALLTLAFLIFIYRRQALRLGVVGLCSLALFGGVKLWLYPTIRVTPTMIRMQPVIHLLAAHLDAGTPLLPEERLTLSRVHPLEDRWNYDPYRGDTTLFGPTFGFSKFTVYPDNLPWIAWRLTWRNPSATIDHFYRSTMFIWRMEPPESENRFTQYFILWDGGINDGANLRYMDSHPPLVEEPKLPRLTFAIWYGFKALRHFSLVRILWSPALRIYALIACVVLWCVRTRDWRGLLLLAPAISNELAIAIGAGGEVAFRFHLPVHFAAYLFLGLLFIHGRPDLSSDQREPNPDRTALDH